MKKLLYIFIAAIVTGSGIYFIASKVEQPQEVGGEPIVGAPTVVYQKTILPLADSTYNLGASDNAWAIGYFDQLCLTADSCKTAWPTGSGGGSAWHQVWTNTLAPTNTSAGIFVYASSTFNSTLRINGNATTTGSFSAGQLLVNNTPLNIANWDTAFGWGNHASAGYASSSGMFVKYGSLEELKLAVSNDFHNLGGVDATGGGAAWNERYVNVLTPTNTSAGIFVNASSTFDGTLRVNGQATTSKLIVGATNPTWNLGVGDAYIAGNATTTALRVTSLNLGGTDITAIDGTALTVTLGTLNLDNTAVTPATYGDANSVGQFTVDQQGRLTGASNVDISIAAAAVSDFTAAWNTLHNATTTYPGAQTQFNQYLNATTTLDVTTLEVLTTLNLQGASITNHYGTACSGNQWLQDIADNGTFSCGNLDVTGDWTGTLDGYNGATLAVNPGAWETFAANILRPTNTAAAILINAASSTITNLNSNKATTSIAVIGATNYPTINLIDGDIWAKRATTTNLAVTTITSCTQALETDAGGNIVCGTDATGGAGGDPGAWATAWTNTLAPTNTSAGIFVYASSTFNSTLRVNGRATTTSLVIGTTNPTGNFGLAGSLWAGSATTTNLAVTGVTASNLVVTDANSTFTGAGTFTNGQLYIGDGDGIPTKATLTAGAGIGITNGAGSITIASAWQFSGLGSILTPTTSGASLLINSATSTITNLRMDNATVTTSLIIPTGASVDVTGAVGKIALDTTSNQFVSATSTDTSATGQVFARMPYRIWSTTISSSTPLVSGDFIPVPMDTDGYTIIRIQCQVINGTSVVVNLSDDGTNDTGTKTCSTTSGGDFATTTANNVWVPGEAGRIELGTNTGSVEDLVISAYGFYTRR